ncbi:MAG: tetratricopeptide repeat protein, partial [Planctomycetes bacterium]|nr:tetratricopeptide repeat protein [Planctomycetota bacterium]
MRSMVVSLTVAGLLSVWSGPVIHLAAPAGESSFGAAENAAQRRVMQRFLAILEKKPRKGVALDRVYGYHVEHGTLEAFVQAYRDRTKKAPNDGQAWMMLGLIESQRGRDGAAVQAFRKAEKLLPKNALASYYLGQSLLLVGQPEQAVEALERAIQRKPERADLLDIFEMLGRIHQRAHHTKEALQVWDRLEKLFPDDLRVQEQIATVLMEEGDREEALKRFELLAQKTKDRYRRVQHRIRAAELKVQLGRTDEATADFEKLLEELRPGSWLFRDVRQRIESVFLRSDDWAGLADYYEKWLRDHPDDVDAMSRLGRVLAVQDRLPEARAWFARAIERAPSDVRLRRELIEQLVHAGRISEAVKEYEALAKIAPNDPDILEQWGQLILLDTSRSEEQRRQAAAVVWNRLVQARPDDAVIVAKAADLFRAAEMTDRAIELYRKAIELAPDAPQYREYLGEYYHSLGRQQDALAAWQGMAQGKNRTTRSLARLAEVLSGFGYQKEALQAMAEACELEPELEDRLRFAEMLRQSKQYDRAIEELGRARTLAATPEERQRVLQETIRCYQASGQLKSRIAALRKELQSAAKSPAESWRQLALYLQAAGQREEAVAAIRSALKQGTPSVETLAVAADLFEKTGQLSDAVETYRQLARIDRRFRTDYLQQVASLEMRLGRVEAALQAGRELLEAAPGSPEHSQFYADLCFRLGRADEGLDVLRRCVRANPSDPEVLLRLADALAGQFRTSEAIELYWRAFDRTKSLDGKLRLISRLTQLHLRQNQFDRLVRRLVSLGRERGETRMTTFCVAAAYQEASDLGSARETLESLLREDTRDVELLRQLSALAEREEDLEAAIRYQRRINELAPSKEGERRMASLLAASGQVDEAQTVWLRLAAEERTPGSLYQTVDDLLHHGQTAAARDLLARWLREHPKDWEALYRQGMACWRLQHYDEAARCFRALLDLDVSEDEPSERSKQVAKSQRASLSQGTSLRPWSQSSVQIANRTVIVWELARYLGLQRTPYYFARRSQHLPIPRDFGQARVAALAGLFGCAQKKGEEKGFVERVRRQAKAPQSTTRQRRDWYYLQAVLQAAGVKEQHQYEAALLLSKTDLTPETAWAYLNSLPLRRYSSQTGASPGSAKRLKPLSDEEIEHMLRCYELVTRHFTGTTFPAIWQPAQVVLIELESAGKKEKADAHYREIVEAARRSSDWIAVALYCTISRNDVATALELLDHMKRAERWTTSSIPPYPTILSQLMEKCAKDKRTDDLLKLLDRALELGPALRRKVPGLSRAAGVGRTAVGVTILSKNPRYVTVRFPLPNTYLATNEIIVLRNAYEFCKEKDKVDELLEHLKQRAETAQGEDRLTPLLARAAVCWWDDRKAPAVEAFKRAVQALPHNLDLQLQLAELYEQMGEVEQALSLVDRGEPLDRQSVQRREILALRLAVRSGNVERARKAAERLFGLRLPVQTQVQLGKLMEQLGMHELAEAVRRRAHRRAGNQTSVLVNLLQQYMGQGQSEVAVQIAHEILRRARPQLSHSYWYSQSDVDTARRLALTVLAQSGQLKELIRRAEQQIERSPRSVLLHERLAEYYEAAGQKDRAIEMLKKTAALRPEDAELQYRIAGRLRNAGRLNEAIDSYLAAFRHNPALFARDYYRMTRLFRQANRMDDLLEFLQEADLKRLGRPYVLSYVVGELIRQKETQEVGLRLLKRAWKAFPHEIGALLSGLYSDQIWQLPEMYELARRALLPKPEGPLSSPWIGMDRIMSYYGSGRISGLVTHAVQAAQSQGQLAEFTEEVRALLKKQPDWKGGEALLAVLEAKQGQIGSARKRIERLLGDKEEPMPSATCWLIGQELQSIESMQDVTIRCFEAAMAGESGTSREFTFSPVRLLVKAYAQKGEREKARRLMLDMLRRQRDTSFGNPPGYDQYRRVDNMRAVAAELLTLGFAVDAFRLYHQATEIWEQSDEARRYGGSYLPRQLQDGRKRAANALTADVLREGLRRWVPEPGEKDEQTPVTPAVDFVMLVRSQQVRSARVESLFERAVNLASQSEAGRQTLEQLQSRLAAWRKKQPDDFSVAVAEALVSMARRKADRHREALDRLLTLVESHPLEVRRPSEPISNRQRQQAAQQLPLWLVARAALREESTRSIGQRLAERALEAARRQSNTGWVLVILRERGQQALDAGDRAAAEADWRQLLHDLVGRDATAGPRQKASGSMRRSLRPLTLRRCGQTLELALMAAENDMRSLCLRAVGEALHGGSPLVETSIAVDTSRALPVASSSGAEPSQVRDQVYAALSKLHAVWLKSEWPAEAVYQTLRDVVLPSSRPAEVFLYRQREALSTLVRADRYFVAPRSAGWILIDWARRAGQLNDLRRRLQKRAEQPPARFSATLLLAELAWAERDAEQVAVRLAELQRLLQQSPVRVAAEAACEIALPALRNRTTAEKALALLEQSIDILTRDRSSRTNVAGGLLMIAARERFRRGGTKQAKSHLQRYLDLGQRDNASYPPSYALRRRQGQLIQVAAELLRAGKLADALETLGGCVDVRVRTSRPAQVPSWVVASLLRQLAAWPAEQRYALLRSWTLPQKGRRSIRLLGGFVPVARPPAAFAQQAGLAAGPCVGDLDTRFGPTPGVATTAYLLIRTADELGRLDELAAEVKTLAEQNVKDAQTLPILIAVYRGRGEEVRETVRRWATAVGKQIQQFEQRQKRSARTASSGELAVWPHYLIFRAALHDPALHAAADRLASQLSRLPVSSAYSKIARRMRADWMSASAVRRSGSWSTLHRAARLAWWTPCNHAKEDRALWVGYRGLLGCLDGTDQMLYFRYPLAGEFDVELKAYQARGAASNLSYGAIVLGMGASQRCSVWTVGRHEQIMAAPSDRWLRR